MEKVTPDGEQLDDVQHRSDWPAIVHQLLTDTTLREGLDTAVDYLNRRKDDRCD